MSKTVTQIIAEHRGGFIASELDNALRAMVERVPRVAGAKVMLGIRLPERRWMELGLIEQMKKSFAEKTGLMAVVGSR